MISQHSPFDPQPARKARYIMLGGFLGAGKTTAVAALAQRLSGEGLRVGLITNDQGSELVDTAMLRAKGFATEEIPGGCFCCRFNSLVDAAGKLTEVTRPEVFIAEPVGSCTDLVATVTYPLRRIYGEQFTIAPLSVLVDPVRAERVFGLAEGKKFSEKVLYIYRKQLEEADLIVITKNDLVPAPGLAALRATLGREFPRAEILDASVREGRGLDEWFARIMDEEQQARATMEVDYELYAEGEALLGWLNATVQLASSEAFDSGAVLEDLATGIQFRLREAEIAHLKMTLSPDDGLGDIAVINLVRSDLVPELSLTLEAPVTRGQLIINCRAEAAPEDLRDAVHSAVGELPARFPGLSAHLEHLEYFRPGKPTPTHRDPPLAV
ncbi:MAG: cobalamin biosynthesis protein P47K [Verrucomicrobiota bacterium]|nr:cobalamin biosynthesis protein P47K [Verrucomicrobiota bacterium]